MQMQPVIGIVSSNSYGDKKADEVGLILKELGYLVTIVTSRKFKSTSFNSSMGLCDIVIVIGCRSTITKKRDLTKVLKNKWTILIELDYGVISGLNKCIKLVDACLVYRMDGETKCSFCKNDVSLIKDKEDEHKKIETVVAFMRKNKKELYKENIS